jgi:hypothetical protein
MTTPTQWQSLTPSCELAGTGKVPGRLWGSGGAPALLPIWSGAEVTKVGSGTGARWLLVEHYQFFSRLNRKTVIMEILAQIFGAIGGAVGFVASAWQLILWVRELLKKTWSSRIYISRVHAVTTL